MSDLYFPPTEPMSRALEATIRDDLKTGIRVWLDADSNYTAFVDRLIEASKEGRFDPVVAYRGSFLEMLFELEAKADGLTNGPLLIHMPGFNEESIRETPVLPYYQMGARTREKLESLVENAAASKVDLDEIEAFMAGGVTSLEEADRWLASQLTKNGSQLGQLSLMEIWTRLKDASASGIMDEEPQAVLAHIRTRVAMDKDWLKETGLQSEFDAQSAENQWRIIGDILLSWSMALEYVNDLKREPVSSSLLGLPDLNQAYSKACTEFVEKVRGDERHQADYIRVANDFAAKLYDEFEQGDADELGHIDTFLFEDQRLMLASLEALVSGEYEQVHEWASTRHPERSIWLRSNPDRASVWKLIREGVRLATLIDQYRHGLEGRVNVDEAMLHYRDGLYEVDLAHRVLEQERVRLLRPSLPEFSRVRSMLDTLRGRHQEWADTLNRSFARICDRAGFLGASHRQQRNFFEEVVWPRVNEKDRLVIMMIDGLRFEMATDLLDRLDTSGVDAKLDARLAELPSVTAVGMNLLAPVAVNNRVEPLIDTKGSTTKMAGFKTHEFQVRTPDSRRRAMFKRVRGHDCPLLKLDEVNNHANLKGSVGGHGLAVVHSLDLDETGEVGHGPRVFDNILMHVVSAIRLLRKANVNRFVIASDHGFLLQPNPNGVGANYSGRYGLSDSPSSDGSTTSVALSELGYDGSDLHVVFARDTRSLGRGSGPDSYVHGGNSLQERVIPVLTLDYRNPSGGTTNSFTLQASKLEVAGSNRVELVLKRDSQQSLGFASNETFEFTLEPVDPNANLEVLDIGPRGELMGEASITLQTEVRHEVDFSIRGPADARSRIRIVPVAAHAEIQPVELDEFFVVVGSAQAGSTEAPVGESASQWDAIEDETVRAVLEHLDQHGAITEQEATRMLGGARQFRRFSRKIVEWQQYLSFDVFVEVAASGKRYKKGRE